MASEQKDSKIDDRRFSTGTMVINTMAPLYSRSDASSPSQSQSQTRRRNTVDSASRISRHDRDGLNAASLTIPEDVEMDLNNPSTTIYDAETAELYKYNLRPIAFTVCSMIWICFPIITGSSESIMSLIYLILNIVLLLMAIPIYAMCVPESTDSIIAAGGKLLNRKPPSSLSNSVIYDDVESPDNMSVDDDNTLQERLHDHETTSCADRSYDIDAYYNRFFNIRAYPYENGTNSINFEARIYNSIPIHFAGFFLIFCNIILTICSLLSLDGDTGKHGYQNGVNQLVINNCILVFFAMFIVSMTLFFQISTHFNQIKDDQRKSLSLSIYIEKLEQKIQIKIESLLVTPSKRRRRMIMLYAVIAVLVLIVWVFYYEPSKKNSSIGKNDFGDILNLVVTILYSLIDIYLLFRLMRIFEYPLIAMGQFCNPIFSKNIQEIMIYWKYRRFYANYIMPSFTRQMCLILSFVSAIVAFSLLYFVIKSRNINDMNNKWPFLILSIFIMMGVLKCIDSAKKLFEIQTKMHSGMLNREVIYLQQKNFYRSSSSDSSNFDDVLSVIYNIRQDCESTEPCKVLGIPINEKSNIIIHGFFLFLTMLIVFVYGFDVYFIPVL